MPTDSAQAGRADLSQKLAALHARCFTVPRAFTAQEFCDLLSRPICFLCAIPEGFALGQVVVGEAELLTIATDPQWRRHGHGRRLLSLFEFEATARTAATAFLEVDAEKAAALALYRTAGYREVGRRKDYYRHPDQRRSDALVMRKPLGSS